jgi:hypothetical protein
LKQRLISLIKLIDWKLIQDELRKIGAFLSSAGFLGLAINNSKSPVDPVDAFGAIILGIIFLATGAFRKGEQ